MRLSFFLNKFISLLSYERTILPVCLRIIQGITVFGHVHSINRLIEGGSGKEAPEIQAEIPSE